ncbi:MAG: FecR domain-containing protein [Pseudomonadota bacterium]
MDDDDPPQGYEEQAAEWCCRLADRHLTDAEWEAYDAWLRADPRHQQVLDEMVAVWKNIDATAEMPGFLTLRAKALNAMKNNARDREDMWSRARRANWYRGIAAVAAMLLMVVSGVRYLSGGPDVYTTGVGERQLVRLKDGSSVSLDASSQVTVSYTEGRRAIVLEHGRAKFDVAKDPLRPFAVTAGHRTVVATGTAFSVELLHNQMRVLLYEGQVAVLAQRAATAESGTTAPVGHVDQLRSGQELVASLSSESTRVVPAEMERSLSWEAGRLDFVDEPLASAVERINRYTDTRVIVGDAATGRYLVNGVFDAGDTRSFVAGLTAIFPISAKQENGKITLVSVARPLPEK